jgi:hypothetical protein
VLDLKGAKQHDTIKQARKQATTLTIQAEAINVSVVNIFRSLYFTNYSIGLISDLCMFSADLSLYGIFQSLFASHSLL